MGRYYFFDHLGSSADENTCPSSIDEPSKAHLPEIEEHGYDGAYESYDIKLYEGASSSILYEITGEYTSKGYSYDSTSCQYG